MNSIYEWLDKACKPLRYKPDREAAYKELKDHYEDHRLYLLDQGAYPGVAERQALEAMGDPKETGRMLSAAYQPVITLLWRASRYLLIIAATMIVVSMGLSFFRSSWGSDWGLFKDPNVEVLGTMEQRWQQDPNITYAEGSCSGTAVIGDYRFSVIRVLSVSMKGQAYAGQTGNSVVLILKAKGPITLGAPEEILYRMSAMDDKGTWYNNIRAYKGRYTEGQRFVEPAFCYSSLGSHYFRVVISNVEPDTEWIDLNYSHWQSRASLRVEFNKEAGL